MKLTKLFLLTISLWLITTSGTLLTRKFPSFLLHDAKGSTHTNKIFERKKTMVVVNYLGCYPAMKLMKDLDSLASTIDTSKHQIIVMLENSEKQIRQFYDTAASGPSSYRKDFGIDGTEYLILAQCSIRKLRRSPKKQTSCNPISKKLFTKASPTLYLIDENGKIIKKSRGYIALSPMNERIKWLNEFVDTN